jgi:predicted dienelactone hydrolase
MAQSRHFGLGKATKAGGVRPLEILFLLCAAAGLTSSSVWARKSPWRWLASVLPAAAAAAQILIEGERWQLFPAYLTAGGIVAAVLLSTRTRTSKSVGLLLLASGFLAILLSATLAALFPVFSFPQPVGPYRVGTFAVQWTDKSRPDIFESNPNVRRTLVVQIYYPAEAGASGRRAPYLANADRVSAQLMAVLGLPRFLVSHLRYVTTNAIENAEPARSARSMPVLIFVSGADGYRNSNYAQVQALASRGYVVLCLDQPGTAASVRLNDGRDVDAIARPLMQRLIDQSLVPVSPVPRMYGRVFPEGFVGYLAEDAIFAREQLTALDSHGILAGKLDLQRVGLFGVSLGGIEVAEACAADASFRACLVMESPMTKHTLAQRLVQPTMFITRRAQDMRKEGWPPIQVARHLNTMHLAYARLRGEGYFVQIAGAFHANFGDGAFLSPLTRLLDVTGPIDGKRCEQIIEAYQRAFFDTYLRGYHAPLLAGPSAKYPEVSFHSHR